MAPTTPAVPTAAALTMPRRVILDGRGSDSAGSPSPALTARRPPARGAPVRGPRRGGAGRPARRAHVRRAHVRRARVRRARGGRRGPRLEALDPGLLLLQPRQKLSESGCCHGSIPPVTRTCAYQFFSYALPSFYRPGRRVSLAGDTPVCDFSHINASAGRGSSPPERTRSNLR